MKTKKILTPRQKTVILPSGEKLTRSDTAVILRFSTPRHVLSTSWMNGGFRRDLSAIFNHQIPIAACDVCHAGHGVKGYLERTAGDLRLDPEKTAGLITRAMMKNSVIVTGSFRTLTVSAIVTAGIDKNGTRAGDPASYYEADGSFGSLAGTINTILVIGADLPEYAMARGVMTATEAKAACLQELMAPSLYSTGIATGSGTDMIAVIADPGSSLHLTDAGTHAKLGELISSTVKRATAAALCRETGLSPRSQRDAMARLLRYDITADDLWDAARPQDPAEQEWFTRFLEAWAQRPEHVAQVAAALHIVDETEWGLVPISAAQTALRRVLYTEKIHIPEGNPRESVIVLLARRVMRDFQGSKYGDPAPSVLIRSGFSPRE